jgi:hypothetical protein
MMYSLYEYNKDTGPNNVIALSTGAGVRLNAIWKQRKEKWYIVDLGDKVVDILTPRQFQDAVDNRKYFFK